MFKITPQKLLTINLPAMVIFLLLVSLPVMASDSRDPVIESLNIGTDHIDDPIINLIEGTTTTVHISGGVRDPDGCGDILPDSISAVFYRSTVDGGIDCSANDANCYRLPSGSCNVIGCDNPRISSVQFTCDVPVRYYAESTVLGRFKSTDWTVAVIVHDQSEGQYVRRKQVEMGAVVGVNVTEAINYGMADLGALSDTQQLIVQNTGNVGLDMLLRAPDPMRCDHGDIPLGSTHVGLRPDTEYTRTLSVGISELKIDLNLSPQNSAIESRRPMYMQIKIPDYGVSGRCVNNITSTAQIDDLW